MALTILGHIAAPGTPGWYSDKWHTAIENHLEWLRNHEEVRYLDLSEGLGYQTAGDFFALMFRSSVPEKYHWVNMRLNGFNCPEEYKGTEPNIRIINSTVVDELYRKVTRT